MLIIWLSLGFIGVALTCTLVNISLALLNERYISLNKSKLIPQEEA